MKYVQRFSLTINFLVNTLIYSSRSQETPSNNSSDQELQIRTFQESHDKRCDETCVVIIAISSLAFIAFIILILIIKEPMIRYYICKPCVRSKIKASIQTSKQRCLDYVLSQSQNGFSFAEETNLQNIKFKSTLDQSLILQQKGKCSIFKSDSQFKLFNFHLYGNDPIGQFISNNGYIYESRFAFRKEYLQGKEANQKLGVVEYFGEIELTEESLLIFKGH